MKLRFNRITNPDEALRIFFAPMCEEFGPVDLSEVGGEDEVGNEITGVLERTC